MSMSTDQVTVTATLDAMPHLGRRRLGSLSFACQNILMPVTCRHKWLLLHTVHALMPPVRSSNEARARRVVTQCTPTKRMAAIIYHEHCRYSFEKITSLWPLKNTSLCASTVFRNYNQVKENDRDCYFNNRKGHVGRKKRISDAEMAEAVERVNAGELIDGEDVRQEMFPDIPTRTVRDSSLIFMPSNACSTRV